MITREGRSARKKSGYQSELGESLLELALEQEMTLIRNFNRSIAEKGHGDQALKN